jgi:metallo-beta-lactamase class B
MKASARTALTVIGVVLGASIAQPGGALPGARRAQAASMAEHRAQCAGKDGWSDPAPPVRVFGDVYDVGTCGIIVLLIAGPAGAIMIDGATAAAVPSIEANVERLGLRARDVKLLLSTHEHLDHAGGLRALRRWTGATMVATAAARRQIESGIPAADDPQRDGDIPSFAGVAVHRIVRDGEVVRLGPLALTAHATPGHAPGSTSWSWRSCEGATCHDMVYADSVSPVAADAYRFSDHPAYVRAFRASLAVIARLRCDLIVTPHPDASKLYQRLSGDAPLSDRTACSAYAATGAARLDRRLASETGAQTSREHGSGVRGARP